jgi:cyclase
MKTIRVIPRLDIKGPNLVKGIHLEGLRVLGKPEDFARHYYQMGADELFFQDVVASLYERNSLHDIIERVANNIFIPITVGGGIRSIADITSVLRVGADKVCLNTAVIKNPNLITEAALKFGSSTIVVTIEAIKESNGQYLAHTDNGREYTGVEVEEWARKVESMGAGEIVITSVDREGTGEGFDTALISKVADAVNVPVIAHGGAGRIDDVVKLFCSTGADAVALASILHYDYIKNAATVDTSGEGNFEFLSQRKSFHNFETTNLQELKEQLNLAAVNCRV